VAICITGQIGRLQPRFLIANLLKANPTFVFRLFYALQATENPVEDLVFNTEHGFHPTRFAYMTPMRIEQELSKDIHKSGNALVKATRFVTPKSIEAWRAFMGNNTLDRMTGFSDEMAQHTILNMYSYHEQCSRDIVEEETSSGRNFDYIVSTREDIYFFHPLDLTVLLADQASSQCNLYSKNCMTWGGINMRFQLLTRSAGLSWLGTRLEFYKSLYNQSRIVDGGPERFERQQMEFLNLHHCPVSVDRIPAAAARHTSVHQFCFVGQELGCIARHCQEPQWRGANYISCWPGDLDIGWIVSHTCPPVPPDIWSEQHANWTAKHNSTSNDDYEPLEN